ncbi:MULTISPECIES: YlzJ-like family protein [unclassified Paenibacillus]|uniref:YlzJ-like family protein n=1 Tax=Paenibacillus provencensis TaxID=441151 RepID=A0ABW3PL56_9BACL|nr:MULTISPECIES: YlzJ-like family protein [unclassified Paenibacillus]MCM3128775.1 YlzJ-like family protein [Paenibacillus sp. MER 78]SFS48571.1 YlzJ-like protein [Paenibacillus sp. 453mf]
MTLYTIMSGEQIFEGMWKEQPALLEMEVEGRLLQIMPVNERSGVIVRLINGSLYDYLDSAYAPGREISLNSAQN